MTTGTRHPIGVGLAGLGLGSALTVPYIASDPRYRIVAAADPRQEARDAFGAAVGGRTYQDVETLVSDAEVELIYVSTPHFMHHEHALMVIAAKRHVLIEKPLARTVEEAAEIVEAARRSGVWALYGHTHALDPVIREMSAIVSSGRIGRLGSILNFNYNDLVYRPRAAWELDARVSGGSPFIQGAHQIDIVRWIAQAPVRKVMGWSASLDEARGMAATHAAMFEFENGAAAAIMLSGYAHFDSARWTAWLAESGDSRPTASHRETLESYRARQTGRVDEAEARNSRRIGAQALRTRPGLGRHEIFGVTIVSCAGGDLRQVPSGVVVEEGVRTTRVRLQPRSGRSVMLDAAYDALRRDEAPSIDAAWAVETVYIAQLMERCGMAARDPGGSVLREVD